MGNEDIVQYIITRKDLLDSKGAGFVAGQVAHASLKSVLAQIGSLIPKDSYGEYKKDQMDEETSVWINGKFKKIVLGVKNLDALLGLEKKLKGENLIYSPINEEFMGGELTTLGLKPYRKNKVAPLLSKYSLL